MTESGNEPKDPFNKMPDFDLEETIEWNRFIYPNPKQRVSMPARLTDGTARIFSLPPYAAA